MDIENFLNSLDKKKETYNKNNDLFIVPKKDKKLDVPHIKNNISKENYLHQADLLFLPTSQFGYKYALVVVDVYNSKMDALPLKNKTPEDIVKALKTIYEENKILSFPHIIQFDSGTEFKGSVKNYLRKNKVSFKYTLPNRHRQNSTVEARNKILGSLILKFQAHKELKKGKKSTEWHKYIKKFVKYINSKLSKPKPINIFADIAGNPDKKGNVEILNLGQKVRKILDYPINAHNNKRVDSKFRGGDIRWSKDIFKITHVILNPDMPPMYMLNHKNNENKTDTSVAYTINQLLKVSD